MPADHELRGRLAQLRADPEMAVLEGFHALKHALRFGAEIVLAAAADPEAVNGLATELAPDVIPALAAVVWRADPELVTAALDRPVRPEVIAFARRPRYALREVLAARLERPVVLLEAPRHLGNLGAVIRVAAAADAAAVLTTGPHDPWDPSAIRAAAGLHFALPVLRIDALPAIRRVLVAIDPGGAPLHGARVPQGAILAFGTERHGLSGALLARADRRLGIPMRAGVSSLNLATAVAVALFRA